MKLMYAGILAGMVLISFAALFLLPAETTGFATSIEPTQRRIVSSVLSTAGVASLGVVAAKSTGKGKGKKRIERGDEFFNAYDDEKKRIVLALDVLKERRIDPYGRVGMTDTTKIVDEIGERYGVDDDICLKVISYLNSELDRHPNYRTRDIAMLALRTVANYVSFQPEKLRRRRQGEGWQI